jgi:hypothetical protein
MLEDAACSSVSKINKEFYMELPKADVNNSSMPQLVQFESLGNFSEALANYD